jgi:hypothetical protein
MEAIEAKRLEKNRKARERYADKAAALAAARVAEEAAGTAPLPLPKGARNWKLKMMGY